MTTHDRREDASSPRTVYLLGPAATQIDATKVWAAEAAVNWAVHPAIESGYQLATGAAVPTARDLDVPFRRILLWAVVTAAAIVAADAAVDRLVLRHPAAPGRSLPSGLVARTDRRISS